MDMLKGQTVFITGGGSGIGKATAAALLEEGANVFVLEFSAERIAETEAELGGDRFAMVRGDVADEGSVRAAFAACIDRFGAIDILVNNAGLGIPTPDLATADLAAYEKMFDVNARGVFLCTREALRHMKPRGSGHIVTLVSMAGQRTNAGAPLYCASKFAARGISLGLADQVIKAGIRVSEINPGPVDSNYWGDREVPREKFLSVRDVAGVIRFVVTMPAHMVVREINFDSMAWLAK
ncbi:MAG: SDR family oxidoreductase [Kiritimatiellae bacterium]|nr:SDR family oxidoreductase [Kiritimatiellia bacterium]